MTSNDSRTTDGRGRLFDNIVDTIGDTPCIRINNLAPDHVRSAVDKIDPSGHYMDTNIQDELAG